MKVLVTGASSRVGQCLATAFSPKNHLVLLGRNPTRLDQIKADCFQSGATEVEAVSIDIEQLNSREAWQELLRGVEVIVHASSSISRKRDDQIPAGDLEKIMRVELVSPLHLFAAAAESGSPPRTIIFISSFLAKIPSPQRLIYGSLKLLQEECLRRIQREHPNTHVLTVNVGTVIPVDRDSTKARLLAKSVVRAYESGASRLNHGRIGQFFVLLFYIQPITYYALTTIQRRLRKAAQPSEPG